MLLPAARRVPLCVRQNSSIACRAVLRWSLTLAPLLQRSASDDSPPVAFGVADGLGSNPKDGGRGTIVAFGGPGRDDDGAADRVLVNQRLVVGGGGCGGFAGALGIMEVGNGEANSSLHARSSSSSSSSSLSSSPSLGWGRGVLVGAGDCGGQGFELWG